MSHERSFTSLQTVHAHTHTHSPTHTPPHPHTRAHTQVQNLAESTPLLVKTIKAECIKQSIFPQFLLLHKGGLSFSANPAFACPRESALGWAFWAAHAVLGGWQDLATGNFFPGGHM